VYYHLDSKSLLMKVYYEMDEYDPFFSLVDAFKIYLRRNKFISDFQRETYHNFILLLNKMMKVKLGKNEMTINLHNEVLSTKPAADLAWLKSKSQELLAKAKIGDPEG
jgi:GTP-binding protein EngB required for normal cell division